MNERDPNDIEGIEDEMPGTDDVGEDDEEDDEDGDTEATQSV